MTRIAQVIRLVHKRDRLQEKRKQLDEQIRRVDEQLSQMMANGGADTEDSNEAVVEDETDDEEVELDDEEVELDDEDEDHPARDTTGPLIPTRNVPEDPAPARLKGGLVASLPAPPPKGGYSASPPAPSPKGSGGSHRGPRGALKKEMLRIIDKAQGRPLDYGKVAMTLYGSDDPQCQHRVRNLLHLLQKGNEIERVGSQIWKRLDNQ